MGHRAAERLTDAVPSLPASAEAPARPKGAKHASAPAAEEKLRPAPRYCLNVTFLLPGTGNHPIGGFKVVYEYANHLTRLGHSVTVVHASRPHKQPSRRESWYRGAQYLQYRVGKKYAPNDWFELDPRVKLLWVPSLAGRYIPRSDAVIATSWRTAEWLSEYGTEKGERFYLIQHLETWDGPDDRVTATWKQPLTKIVIAEWLGQHATQLGEPSHFIPNGLSLDQFSVEVPIRERDPFQVMMLYHDLAWKGSWDGIAALSAVKRQIPELKASLFGVPEAPKDLPSWITYSKRPTQVELRSLYNQAAIFLAPSWTEGWPLPPAEALMSGAALVATDIGGHRAYASHGETALLSPPRDDGELAKNLARLVLDGDLRIRLAENGNRHIQQFTWERASALLEKLLLAKCRAGSSNVHA